MKTSPPPTPKNRHNGSSVRVLTYLREHPDVVIPHAEVARALDIPTYTVSNSISTLILNNIPVERPSRGTVIYHSTPVLKTQNAEPTKNLFELVGKSHGRVIVRDESDELYYLTPLFTEEAQA